MEANHIGNGSKEIEDAFKVLEENASTEKMRIEILQLAERYYLGLSSSKAA
ncbi:hypothetical protein VCHA35O137_30191 [Vibrio chagasii]|nr:hypothetical protein VCHA35O137_30191 [Vibrio chagasii]CAH7074159.1 hypothetical protein VCHA52P454_10699 [Vibrio chagasii]CAH7444177.1 hypothetical protein VCHA48O429_30187 [Vibrio chagasii]